MFDNGYDEFGYEVETKINNFTFNNIDLRKKIMIGGIILIFAIIAIVVISMTVNYYNSYKYYENKMVKIAKDYIKNNNIVINDEIYLDISNLNITIPKSCSQVSGVFVDKNYNYNGYLLCEDYETDIIRNDTNKAILNGSEVVLLAKGIRYIEMGVNGYKNVNIQGEVGSEEGVYNLNYVIVSNGAIVTTLNRKVVVVDNQYIKSLFPTLTFKGDEIEYLQKGEKYIDKGVLASDSVDWDLTAKVKTIDSVDSMNVGEYNVIYTVTNSRGYTNSLIRKVVVVNNFSETMITANIDNKNATNQNVTITLKVIGNNYNYMILPDGNKTYSKTITYIASKNDDYSFYSYDNNGKVVTKIVQITNINKEKPKASCNAIVYATYVKVHVIPYENTKISSYNYIANGISSGEKISSNYDAKISNVKNVNVVIKDSLGNINDISCTLDTSNNYLRDVYVDSKGKNCLEGFKCYSQGDYRNTNVRFCSSDTENSCGTVAKHGCSVSSFATAISVYAVRDSSGDWYDPEELVVEHFNKVCSTSCSGTTAAKNVAIRLGLSTSTHYSGILKNKDILINFLKKGYPVLFTTNGNSVYTTGGHVMAILGINERGEVFLSDPGRKGTNSALSKKHKVNSWVTIEEIASGAGDIQYFQAICPAGMC